MLERAFRCWVLRTGYWVLGTAYSFARQHPDPWQSSPRPVSVTARPTNSRSRSQGSRTMPASPRLPRLRPHAWLAALLVLTAGCDDSGSAPELVWGRRGVRDGDLVKPRAIAIDAQ